MKKLVVALCLIACAAVAEPTDHGLTNDRQLGLMLGELSHQVSVLQDKLDAEQAEMKNVSDELAKKQGEVDALKKAADAAKKLSPK